MAQILVADASEDFARSIAQMVASQRGAEVQRVDVASTQGEPTPAVVVFGPSNDPMQGVEFAKAAASADTHIAVVVVANEVTTELLRAGMKADVSDIVAAKDPATEISGAILEAYRTAVELRKSTAESATDGAGESDRLGSLLTVFSTKGGVGKTVLSTNLAAALAHGHKKSTCIVDLDLQFGDVGIMLGMAPERTIVDVCSSMDRLDADLLRGYLTHHSSGLDAMLAPIRPEDAESITSGRIARILDLLRTMYEFVVVDTAASFDETLLTALDRSDFVYAVTMMDVASIKNTRISLQKLVQLGYDNINTRLLLNRADSKVFLQPAEVEKAVGASIFAKIPSDRLVPRSVNKGAPVVLDEPRSDVAKAITGIAEAIVRSAEEMAADVA